jgi:hypothetical protein
MTERYRSDYPTKKAYGSGNPYYACAACGRTDPDINGRLEGHEETCAWRLEQTKDARLIQIRAIALELKGIVDDGSSETLVDQIIALTGGQ